MTANSINPPITPDERKRWELDPNGAPIDPDPRERWQRDPAAYYALERLHDASADLREAVWDRLNEAGILLYGGTPGEQYAGIRERHERAQRAWAAALARVEELTPKGGE